MDIVRRLETSHASPERLRHCCVEELLASGLPEMHAHLENQCSIIDAKSPHVGQALGVMVEHRLGGPFIPRVIVLVAEPPDPI